VSLPNWTNDYLGLPFIVGERDCWSFFRQVQNDQFKRKVAAIDINAKDTLAVMHTVANHLERKLWFETDDPQLGDGVLMAKGEHPFHVGCYIGSDYILHCIEPIGVILQTIVSLRLHGWQNLRFYRHASCYVQ